MDLDFDNGTHVDEPNNDGQVCIMMEAYYNRYAFEYFSRDDILKILSLFED